MRTLSEEQKSIEWSKFLDVFEKTGLAQYYDLDKIKDEVMNSPCALQEDSGTAYKGALLLHINMTAALAQRMAKMISGTFEIDEMSMLKSIYIMHLSKRLMYVENENEWEVKNRGMVFKFSQNMEGCLKCGERSALEALNNGVTLTPLEFEAIKTLDDMEDISRNAFRSIMSMIVRQSNELAYAIEKERYKKTIKK